MFKVKSITLLFLLVFIAMFFNGCLYYWLKDREPTYKDFALDQIWHIATEEQREELKLLDNVDEINDFLENFWKTNDPTPNTPENEFREEYLKRVEYANLKFKSSIISGCRTDMGRIYCFYGPPDEITDELLPEFTKSKQIWEYDRSSTNRYNYSEEYHFQNMAFVFMDEDGFGEYFLIYSTEEGEVGDARHYPGINSNNWFDK